MKSGQERHIVFFFYLLADMLLCLCAFTDAHINMGMHSHTQKENATYTRLEIESDIESF